MAPLLLLDTVHRLICTEESEIYKDSILVVLFKNELLTIVALTMDPKYIEQPMNVISLT